MPILVDGNNLMYELAVTTRAELCRILGDLVSRLGEDLHVVFDGPPPEGRLAEGVEDPRITVSYSGHRPADDIIQEHIAANTAPRRLTVVSSDRAIRRAARRRQCTDRTSPDFAAFLEARLAEPPPPGPDEPAQKRHGLSPEETRRWLREFDLDDDL